MENNAGAEAGRRQSIALSYQFRSMFPKAEKALSNPQGLLELGRLMLESPDQGDHPSLPAGYTYLGQLIAHDISCTKNTTITIGPQPSTPPPQSMNPSLDLDTLYGEGPKNRPELYKEDRAGLILGKTIGSRSLDNDLPRLGNVENRLARIADPRNDDHLALAQIVVAFIKFHNLVVERLKERKLSGERLFEEARRTVVLHYQSIIFHDFLPRLIPESILNQALTESPLQFFIPAEGETAFAPIEFSHGAFRFGHSLIRSHYSWNTLQDKAERNGMAPLHELISLTGRNGTLHSSASLPTDWVIDWTRFFELEGSESKPNFNKARKIQPSYTKALQTMSPGMLKSILPPEYRSIASLDLLRGREVGLPSGQRVAEALGVASLEPTRIASGLHEAVLKKYQFDQETPLLYYILKEAELSADNRLGEVGGRIVAETMVGLARASQDSIFPRDGKEPLWPIDLRENGASGYRMADLLMFLDRNSPGSRELNPFS